MADGSPAAVGRFSEPFVEPTINGKPTGAKCLVDGDGVVMCKPAAGSVTVMPDGRALYWNALEGTERGTFAQYGTIAPNDQSRVLDLRATPFAWSVPDPVDGGANRDGIDHTGEQIIPGTNTSPDNDGALFCSDLNLLPDGRVLAVGGSAYYLEPDVAGQAMSEWEGLRNARIYDPKTNAWSQTGSMATGRWYPTVVTLGDGRQLVASGVLKIAKPVYPSHIEDSGSNVRTTETYDPASGSWSENGSAAERSLPLYPRLHLLPNGHVLYAAGGQAWNPGGPSYDQAQWNEAASYDPASRSWTALGVPGLEAGGADGSEGQDAGAPVRDLLGFGIPGGGSAHTIPGFRGSTFSVMLPLRPQADGRYAKAEILTAGGVVSPPSPGSYLATSDSRITTIDTAAARPRMSSRPTGDMTRPRWYTSAVLLPTGDVLGVSGSDRDHVMAPGFEFPITQAELFDVRSGRWHPVASASQARTYHNTAALLPDGRVLIGGHAPIQTGFYRHNSVPGAAPNDGRDPSFELYEPPYLFRGRRPRIRSVTARPRYDRPFGIRLSQPIASDIESVVLVRHHSTTHLVDADQRSVELRIVRRDGNLLMVSAPPDGNVAPPGPYMLFVNRRTSDGPVPSAAARLMVGQPDAGSGRRARIAAAR